MQIGNGLRVTLASGGVSLLAQGLESGWILIAVAVFASSDEQSE
ncbi:hypothetical protein [Haloarchaeobius sp. DT45]